MSDVAKEDAFKHKGIVLTKAAAGAIPWIGGTLSVILDEVLPDYKIRRINAALKAVADAIESVKEEVNEGYLRKDEFSQLAEDAIKAALSTDSETFHKFYGAFIANALRRDPLLNYDAKQHYLKTLGRLSVLEVQILWILSLSGLDFFYRVLPDKQLVIGAYLPEIKYQTVFAAYGGAQLPYYFTHALSDPVATTHAIKSLCNYDLARQYLRHASDFQTKKKNMEVTCLTPAGRALVEEFVLDLKYRAHE